MNIYQVRHKVKNNLSSTNWHSTIGEARREALEKKMPIESEIVELKIVGHEAMAEAIKLLMNGNEPMVKFIRNLGSAAAVKKSKVIPIHKANKIQAPQLQIGSSDVAGQDKDKDSNVFEIKRPRMRSIVDEEFNDYRWDNEDLILTGIPATGVLVEQGGRAYLAKRQILNSRVVAIFEIAIQLGFRAAIQKNHPRSNRLLPEGDGVGYLSLGISYEGPWALTINSIVNENCIILINKKYEAVLLDKNIKFRPNTKAFGHLAIDFLDMFPALSAIKQSAGGHGKNDKKVLENFFQKLINKRKRSRSVKFSEN